MIPLPRAALIEARLNSGRLATSALVCLTAGLLAVALTDSLMSLLPFWAGLAWYRHGRADTLERDELRASLGLSRADKVRGRVAVISAETALLLATMIGWFLLAPMLGRSALSPVSVFMLSGPPELPAAVLLLDGVLMSVAVLLLTAIVMGGETLTRRPGASVAVLSVVIYLLLGLGVAVLVGLPLIAQMADGDPTVTYLVITVLLVALVAVLVPLLRRRVRTWIRLLDSGPLAAPAVVS